jgi:LysM repeat protein
MGIKYMKHLKFFVFSCIITFFVSCGQQRKYIQYQVKEGETIREIARRLDMKTKDLLRLNPNIDKNLAVNTFIVIPNKAQRSEGKKRITQLKIKDSTIEESTNSKIVVSEKEKQRILLIEKLEKKFKIHEVVKGETFYSLTRFYNVTKTELVQLNPLLSEGLKLGQLIRIKPIARVFEEDELLYKDIIKKDVSIKLAIMLPFISQELDTLSGREIFDSSRLATIVTDLYLGAELAIDSLRKQGVKIDVNVFDTGRNGTGIHEIIAENKLDENTVIIGPLYSEEVQILSERVSAPIVFPVYSKDQSSFHGNEVIKTAPSKGLFRNKLLRHIQENFIDGNIIIVGDRLPASLANVMQIQEILFLKDSIARISVIRPEEGYIKKEKLLELVLPKTKNIVIMTTNDDIIVASTINSLISLPKEVTATVFTFDKTSAFNKIDNAKLAQLGFTFVSDEYVREDAFKAVAFNKKYEAKNGALPSYYATRGFDVTYDVLMRLASGNSLEDTFKQGFSYRVESKFDYTDERLETSQNVGLFIVKYNSDLTLTRIK